ncbi:MAG: methyltransferase domain-containing protein, partial [Nitrosopumilaceae archaeon]|nr:methyltransferase domain-containing protein [Nitrosopumilaceae archaeon]
ERSGEKIIVASAEDLPFKNNSFDLVCAFDVIEHIENDTRSVEEMKRVCNNGGSIFITVPAYMILWSHHDVVNQHKRRYITSEIESLFNTKDDSGTELYKTYFNSILLPPILLFRLLSRIIPDSLIRKGAGSDFTIVNNESLINKLLYQLFSLEKFLLKHITFPFGSSILYAWKKSL